MLNQKLKAMLQLKKIKETERELAHTEVYLNKKLLGYFIPNKSKFSVNSENWVFVPKCSKVRYFNAKTKDELLETLEKQIKKEKVVLKQHFGIEIELN